MAWLPESQTFAVTRLEKSGEEEWGTYVHKIHNAHKPAMPGPDTNLTTAKLDTDPPNLY